MRAALWCFSCFLRREAASRAGAGLLLCSAYFFEFGEPEPGRGASRFDCDSVWRVETLLRLVKPAMPVIWPAWILCSLLHRSFSVQSQVCLGTKRMSSDARRINRSASAQKPRCRDSSTALSLGTRRAGYAKREGLRNTPGNPTARYRSREASAEH